MRIQFEGAAHTVTGSQTVVEHRHFSLLVDCGLYQGPKALRQLNWDQPSFVKEIKAVILTHAHIDHSGLLPRWSRWGWRGPVYCTPATAELLSVMLLDAAQLQEEDARFANMTKHSHHEPALPLYTTEDAREVLNHIQVVEFDHWFNLTQGLSFRFLRAGHILGSALVQISYAENDRSELLTFSGDLGGGHSDLLKEPVTPVEVGTLILESTYGNRKVDSSEREAKLAEVITRVLNRGGTLVVPAFALGRTQDLLFSIRRLREEKLIPEAPVYLDSPMAKAVTQIYLHHLSELRLDPLKNHIEEALSPPFFRPVETPDESMLLCMSDEPKIVLSASGMLQGGRVLHHLKKKLPDPKNAVLFVGFQGAETKGRLLQEGLTSLRIHHQEVSVEAEIFTVEGYSAHADADDLLRWLRALGVPPKRIFLNHGEAESQNALAEKIFKELNLNCEIPSLHQSYRLSGE